MKIQLYHATAGHGHKKVAEVIADTFLSRGFPKDQLEVHDVLDLGSPLLKTFYPTTYFYSVKYIPKIWGWFYDVLDKQRIYSPLFPIRSLHNRFMGKNILHKVIQDQPDVILVTHFFSAELFATAKRRGLLKSLLVTVITDFLPHTFWVNEGTDYYWVMGEEGKRELLRRGVSEQKIIAGGIPVADAFKPSGRKEEILKHYNFETNRFTLLFTSGSFGLGHQEAILKELRDYKDRIQCFMVCGHNKTLEDHLSKQEWDFPIRVFGFVDFMPDLMEASDLILAKPGGSTTTESLSKGIPMVILDPIPGQETRNAKLLLAKNASFCMSNPSQIKTILNAIFQNPSLLPDKLAEIRQMARPNAADDLVTFVLEKVQGKV